MTQQLATMFRTDVRRSMRALTPQTTVPRRVRAALVRGLVLPLILFGVLAAAPWAGAGEWTDHSGTICKNYNAGEVGYIDYFVNGTRSLSSTGTSLICPLTRNTTGTYGAYFYVNVTHSGTQTTYCSAYSHRYDGAYIASNSGNWTGSGSGLIGISLYGANYSDTLSNYSVLCYVPGSGAGVLNTVDFYEY
jgi:hypothetical protein